jgi:hypothetical protein
VKCAISAKSEGRGTTEKEKALKVSDLLLSVVQMMSSYSSSHRHPQRQLLSHPKLKENFLTFVILKFHLHPITQNEHQAE